LHVVDRVKEKSDERKDWKYVIRLRHYA
jgi:hypothetical protein